MFLNKLAQEGYRIFTYETIRPVATQEGYSESYLNKILYLMAQSGQLQSFGNGLYALATEFLSGGPLHSFEIAMAIAKKGAISYRSAMSFHGLSDQVTNSVYVKVPLCQGSNLSKKTHYDVGGVEVIIQRLHKEAFWGFNHYFIGEVSILITDVERTLLDGLISPHLCGGFLEVIQAIRLACSKISPRILLDYCEKFPTVVSKRLGWILDSYGISFSLLNPDGTITKDIIDILEAKPALTPQKLNPAGERRGHFNKKWMVLENLV